MIKVEEILGAMGFGKQKKDKEPSANPLKTKEGARSYMLESTTLTDWKARGHHILEVNDHSLPSWWMGLIITDPELRKLKASLDAKDKENRFRRR